MLESGMKRQNANLDTNLRRAHRLEAHATMLPVALTAVLAWVCPVIAQPSPALTNMAPVYLRQGELREITLSGQNLGNAKEALLAEPKGITAMLIIPAKPIA